MLEFLLSRPLQIPAHPGFAVIHVDEERGDVREYPVVAWELPLVTETSEREIAAVTPYRVFGHWEYAFLRMPNGVIMFRPSGETTSSMDDLDVIQHLWWANNTPTEEDPAPVSRFAANVVPFPRKGD